MNERPGGRVRAAAVLLTAIAATMVWPTVATAAPSGQVYLLQGLPGRNVDLFLNGEKVGSDVAPKTVVGPLALAAGSYQLRVAAVGGSTLLQRAITVGGSDSLDAIVQVIAVTARNASAPNDIDTGSGGAAAPSQHTGTSAALFGTGFLLLSIAAAALRRRRREPS